MAHQVPFGDLLLVQHVVHHPPGHVLGDPLGAQFLGEAELAPGAEADPVAYEGGRHGPVIEETPLLQPVQARLHPGEVEALSHELPLQLGAGAGPVRQDVQRRLSDLHFGVGVQELVLALGGKGIAHPQTQALERFQRHFQRLSLIQVHTHLEPPRPQGFQTGDEGLIPPSGHTNVRPGGRGRG